MVGASPSRMLNACAGCGRQYDVTHLQNGSRVRCECGARFEVLFRAAHSPRALKCSSCGGLLREAAARCDYCAAEITLEERRLSSICPVCFARAGHDARFCMDCGVELAPQAIAAVAEDSCCPRCKTPLRSRTLGDSSVIECARCGGLWLSKEAFVRVCEQSDAQSVVSRELGAAPPQAAAPNSGATYVRCPFCDQFMWRKNYGQSSGVLIDVCKQHGVWLDHRELERILAFIRGGGLERSRRRQIEKLEQAERRAEASAAPMLVGSTGRSVLSGLGDLGVEVVFDGLLGAILDGLG